MLTSFRYRFEAAHRLTSSSSPSCQTPHGHTWFVTVSLSAQKTELDENNMVTEFANTKKSWKKFIQEIVDHSFFYNQNDPIVSSLKEHISNFRGLAFPGDPTTEMIAILFLKKAEVLFSNKEQIVKEIFLEETQVNSVRLHTQSEVYQSTIAKLEKLYPDSWWQSSSLELRNFTS